MLIVVATADFMDALSPVQAIYDHAVERIRKLGGRN